MRKRILILTALIIAAVLYFFAAMKIGIGIPCPIRLATGFYCPGCGTGRMILEMLRLNFYQAFRYNPVVFVLTPFLAVLAVTEACSYISGKKSKLTKRIPRIFFFAATAILLVFGVLRNIPALSFLAPTML